MTCRTNNRTNHRAVPALSRDLCLGEFNEVPAQGRDGKGMGFNPCESASERHLVAALERQHLAGLVRGGDLQRQVFEDAADLGDLRCV